MRRFAFRSPNRYSLKSAKSFTLVEPVMTILEQRRQLSKDIEQYNVAPLWEVMDTLVTPEPSGGCLPIVWRYEDIRPAIMPPES
jgi:gentisate 1,2-dioxygenase